MTTTQINYWNYVESQRHNLVGEAETMRHNKMQEVLTTKDLQIKSYSAKETRRHNVITEKISSYTAKEGKRHNLATEKESKRHNVANEKETNRHNLSTEDIEKSKVQESVRHNQATESLESTKQAETKRHNVASEDISTATLNETIRHNTADEQIKTITAEATKLLNSVKSVTEFSRALDAAGMKAVNKVFLIAELINNGNVGAETKKDLYAVYRKALTELGFKDMEDAISTWGGGIDGARRFTDVYNDWAKANPKEAKKFSKKKKQKP